MAKKKYGGTRTLHLVCVKCRCLFKGATCEHGIDNTAWILADDKELKHYFNTGLVPDWKAFIHHAEGTKKPPPIPLEWPQTYGFKID